MLKLKSHKTVEQIAKKHRMEVSFIQKQLDMGEPIEHEHTKDHTLAMDIALQHLDEIPDYYTRLKKMEASAKKEHKKFNDVNINEAGSLHHWFNGSKSKDGKPGWVQADGSPCANEPGETKAPKCFSSARLAALKRKGKKGESLIRSAVNRKRQKDSGQQQKSGAAKPTNVPTFAKGRKSKDYVKPEPGLKETMEIQEAQKDTPSKGKGTKDACYTKVKSRYDVWPSAYASGALVKCRKVGADNWGNKSEAVEEQRYCPLCDKREARSECSYGEKAWEDFSVKDHEYSMARSELSTIMNAANRLQKRMGKGEGNIEAWVQSKITKAADYLDTAADYVESGEMSEAASPAQQAAIAINMKKKGIKPKLKEHRGIVAEILRDLQKEDITIEDANGNTFAEVVDVIKPEPIKGFKQQVDEATRLPATTGNIISVMLNWRGKTYGTKMFFPQTKLPTRKDVEYEIQKVYPDCRILTYKVAEFVPGQALIYVDNTKSKNYLMNNKTIGEDWQSINRKDNTDGMSKAAVDEYRRENKGSNLQTAVTEKKPTGKRASRRKNFCSRMSGMKSKLTSAKTANDPDSRINRALRRWNCR